VIPSAISGLAALTYLDVSWNMIEGAAASAIATLTNLQYANTTQHNTTQHNTTQHNTTQLLLTWMDLNRVTATYILLRFSLPSSSLAAKHLLRLTDLTLAVRRGC
jgi:hypothetical protein